MSKKGEKKLTNVNFAFTYTCTLDKLKFNFFPKTHMEHFQKCKKSGGERWGGGGYNSPLGQRFHPITFKSYTLKDNCIYAIYSNYCWEKMKKKKKHYHFWPTHTYIHKLTFVSLFSLFIFSVT